jgi:hypothetical protein
MSTRATRRHLRLIPSPAHPYAAEREFAVRFTPKSERAVWWRGPANGLGCVGSGTVRIERDGVQVSAKRMTLFGLRHMQRLIRPADILDVYREGNAVEITLREGARGPSLRLWAAGVAEAAELVARLPTNRTIELETLLHPPWDARASRRLAWWLLALAAAVLLALGGIRQFRLAPLSQTAPQPAAGAAHEPAQPADELGRAVAEAPEAEVLQARAELGKFSPRFDGLSMQFATAFDALTHGELSQQEFAHGLEQWLVPQWATLTGELPTESSGTLRARAGAELREVSASWQRALTLYAAGLRAQDTRVVSSAFDALRSAERHAQRVQLLLGDLERRQLDTGGSGARSAH